MNVATQLPEKVVSVLGQEATEELLDWLNERMQKMLGNGAEQVRLSPFSARQMVNVLMVDTVSNLVLMLRRVGA